MTAEERWPTETRPASILYSVESNNRKAFSSRKNRLFACGCYRMIWEKIRLRAIKELVELAEQRADRVITQKQFEATGRTKLHSAKVPAKTSPDYLLRLYSTALLSSSLIPNHIAWLTQVAVDPSEERFQNKWLPCPQQAELARCVYGNPFRPVTFDPAWRTEHTVGLAAKMYDDREFAAMPILADALEEAGCDNADILTHCREPGVHVRGCWVVDLVLGKS